MHGAYREDLAYVHDAGFGCLAANAAALLIGALRKGGAEDGLVVDLCCGSGPLSRRLSDAGYDIIGVDISGAMVELARARVPEGRFVEGSILSTQLSPCVAVAAVGECFNYLFDEGNTEEGSRDLLRRIHAALAPGSAANVRGRRRLGGAGNLRGGCRAWGSDPPDHHLPQGGRTVSA